jgi:hypothetical protein
MCTAPLLAPRSLASYLKKGNDMQRLRFAALGVLVLGVYGGVARGQASDAALRDRVAQLVERLGSDKPETREAAEKALIGLGAKALPLLPEASKVAGKELKERVEKVREALVEAAEQGNLGASKVTIQGKGIRLSEAVRQLQSQTGNAITDLREQLGTEVTNPSLDLDIVDKPFFEALDIVARKADVVPNFFTGDGSVGLMAGPMTPEAEGTPAADGRYVLYPGPFRVAFKQVFATRDLQAGSGSANAQFEVAWEPRLRPMLLALKAEDLKIVDDQGKSIKPTVMQESTDVVLRPDNPASELNINMAEPERAARTLASIRVKGEVTVPAGLRTFKFPSLAAKDVKQTQGDISVTLEDLEIDEQVWKVHVNLVFPGEGPAFESYRQGLFNNRLWLQKPDGSRFEWNGGFSNTGNDGGKLGFEYLFVEAPGKPSDYQFVYETPSKVLTIPLDFEFKDVPLP